MRKLAVVRLSGEARAYLRTLIGAGTAPARLLTHARILLKADQGEGGPGRGGTGLDGRGDRGGPGGA